jgi:fructose-1,6-bisphosphatase I
VSHTDNIETLESYLKGSELAAADVEIVSALASASIALVQALRAGVRGKSPTQRNCTGDLVRDADVLSNDLFVNALSKVPHCGGMLTEETRVPVDFGAQAPERFVLVDPLDGSANMDSHGVTGTIFSVVPWQSDADTSAKISGKHITTAGYILYAAATVLVLAERDRVNLFVLDPVRNEFILSEADVRCPDSGCTYSTNEANVARWPQTSRDWLTRLKSGKLHGRPYSQRYAGALVADAHRALLTGGIFVYPADSAAAKGKLRLQYEVNPMSFVFRAAGGAATTGSQDPLELIPEQGHERAPLIIGSREEVTGFERAHRRGNVTKLRTVPHSLRARKL